MCACRLWPHVGQLFMIITQRWYLVKLVFYFFLRRFNKEARMAYFASITEVFFGIRRGYFFCFFYLRGESAVNTVRLD